MQISDTDILICGAGPTGLMLACQFAAFDTDFRIIDKRRDEIPYSGALIVHAATLEIFSWLDLADAIVHEGTRINNMHVRFNNSRTVTFPLGIINEKISPFPFFLLIEQSKIMHLMHQFLKKRGHFVEKGKTLTDSAFFPHHVESFIQNDRMVPEVIRSAYLIGADGSQSEIRKSQDIPMTGKTHQRSLFIMDCLADTGLATDDVLFSFSDEMSSGIFPLSGGRWRIDGAILNLSLKDRFENEQYMIKEMLGVKRMDWFSEFRSESRIAEVFRYKRCFLAGDAAHIFSPVGAQGMNYGFYDAANLSWKLSSVIKHRVRTSILDSYEAERKPAAIKAAQITSRLFVFLSYPGGIMKFFRLKMLPVLLKIFRPIIHTTSIRSFLFKNISGTGIVYRNTLTGTYKRRLFAIRPSTGDRIPYVFYQWDGKNLNIQNETAGGDFSLLVFLVGQKHVTGSFPFSDRLHILIFRKESTTHELFRRFRIFRTTYFIVRPDFYIAFRGHRLKHVEKFLNGIFIKHENERTMPV